MGAPFAAMLRRHELDYNDSNDCVLKIVVVFLSTSSNVVQVKYSSIALQVNHHLDLILYVNTFFSPSCAFVYVFSFFPFVLFAYINVSLWPIDFIVLCPLLHRLLQL